MANPQESCSFVNRRQFLQDCGTVSFASWLALEWQLESSSAVNQQHSTASTSRAGFVEVALATRDPESLIKFYRDVIGWKTEFADKRLTVYSGATKIRFDVAAKGNDPYYHLAWSIPPSKFHLAKTWLSDRTALLRTPDGRDEIRFSNDRRAVYFEDPAHNILELIARPEVPDESQGDFGLSDIESVNHVGLVVDDVFQHVETAEARGDLPAIGQPVRDFAKTGNEYRHVVFVPEGRLWFPEQKRKAIIAPADLVVEGTAPSKLVDKKHQYSITNVLPQK